MDKQDEPSLAAMTINERLFHVGVLRQFDAAARARDRVKMIALLEQVEVEQADRTVDTILANPKEYGY